MRISDLISMCTRNLTRRKFRTFLTVMGVVIGTCFIVVMISLGIGIGESQTKMLESWGDLTLIEVNNYGNTETPLDDAAMTAIKAIPGVAAATPIVQMNLNQGSPVIYAGRRNRYQWYAWNLIGIYPEAMEPLGYTTGSGDILQGSDGGKKINVMFGENTAYDFQDAKKRWPHNQINYWDVAEGEAPPDPFFDPLETPLVLEIQSYRENGKNITFDLEVVGVLKGDYRKGYETMYGAVMDLNDLKRIQSDFERANNIKKDRNAVEGYETAKVKCASIDYVADVELQIRAMGFLNTYSLEQERQSMQESAEQIQLILGAIGGVALVVSAISIMNTMIMSVYERTREIGVMKVLGCMVGNIRSIFLMEAGLIGFMGGVIGNTLSYLASFLLNTYGGSLGETMGMGGYQYDMAEAAPKISIIPLWLMLLGLCFATSVGLVSGILPALRAVKISALEAIRTE